MAKTTTLHRVINGDDIERLEDDRDDTEGMIAVGLDLLFGNINATNDDAPVNSMRSVLCMEVLEKVVGAVAHLNVVDAQLAHIERLEDELPELVTTADMAAEFADALVKVTEDIHLGIKQPDGSYKNGSAFAVACRVATAAEVSTVLTYYTAGGKTAAERGEAILAERIGITVEELRSGNAWVRNSVAAIMADALGIDPSQIVGIKVEGGEDIFGSGVPGDGALGDGMGEDYELNDESDDELDGERPLPQVFTPDVHTLRDPLRSRIFG